MILLPFSRQEEMCWGVVFFFWGGGGENNNIGYGGVYFSAIGDLFSGPGVDLSSHNSQGLSCRYRP